MTTTQRPKVGGKVTRKTEEKRHAELDQGYQFKDEDGTLLQVTVRTVKGRHDAALVAATGMDFMGLLDAVSRRQGLDLLAAIVWFGRLVNDRDAGTYLDMLDSFSYEDVMALDFDEASHGGDTGPEV